MKNCIIQVTCDTHCAHPCCKYLRPFIYIRRHSNWMISGISRGSSPNLDEFLLHWLNTDLIEKDKGMLWTSDQWPPVIRECVIEISTFKTCHNTIFKMIFFVGIIFGIFLQIHGKIWKTYEHFMICFQLIFASVSKFEFYLFIYYLLFCIIFFKNSM